MRFRWTTPKNRLGVDIVIFEPAEKEDKFVYYFGFDVYGVR